MCTKFSLTPQIHVFSVLNVYGNNEKAPPRHLICCILQNIKKSTKIVSTCTIQTQLSENELERKRIMWFPLALN